MNFTLGILAYMQHSSQLLFKALLQACLPEMYSLLKFSHFSLQFGVVTFIACDSVFLTVALWSCEKFTVMPWSWSSLQTPVFSPTSDVILLTPNHWLALTSVFHSLVQFMHICRRSLYLQRYKQCLYTSTQL